MEKNKNWGVNSLFAYLKKECDWLKEVNSQSLQQSVQNFVLKNEL